MKRWLLIFTSALLTSSPLWAANTLINGAGASFPNPIYTKWFSTYNSKNPETRINYQSIGSGGGIRQLTQGTVDFGASDAPMSSDEEKKVKGKILHVPTVLGAVTLSYNLELKQPLKLDGESVAKIFMGEVKKWNDPVLVKLNPGLALPDKSIVVVHRSDGSGTTSVFTDYLSKVSNAWKTKVGEGKAIKWPTGVGAKGNEGVSGMVKQTPGSIGYIELVYALTNKQPTAVMKNKAGEFVTPSAESVSQAADGSLKEMIGNGFKISITNADGAKAYPISSFTWILVSDQMDTSKEPKLIAFLNWALGEEGQKLASEMNYAPLPKSLRTAVLSEVNKLDSKASKKK